MRTSTDQGMPNFCNRRFPFHYATALNTLTKLGIDLHQVDMLAVGEYENYKGEIIAQEPEPGTPLGADTKITLQVGFPSAVDYMPYQFFYGLQGITAQVSGWENRARSLMAPFDSAVIRYTAIADFESLKNSFGFIEFGHLKRFLKLFDFALDEHTGQIDEALIWSAIFPTFHHWAGNARLVGKVLNYLFGYEFEIVENIPKRHEIPEAIRYRLGMGGERLGQGSVIGASFVDCDSAYDVIINGVRAKDVGDLLPGGRVRRKLEQALDICMPSNLVYTIKVITIKQEVRPGNARGDYYLGYSSRI